MSDESETEMEQDDKQVSEECSEKQVRREYRKYREEMIENRLECVDPNSNLIEDIIERVERTFKSVKKPREAVSDSNALHELAILGTERIKNLHCAFRSFNNSEFMDKLKLFMAAQSNKAEAFEDDDDSESNQEGSPSTQNRRKNKTKTQKKYVLTKPIIIKFGTDVMSYFRILPKPKFLLGSLTKELVLGKKKLVRQNKAKNKDSEVACTKIKELVDSKEAEINNTVGETERIHKILQRFYKRSKGMPICLYEFLINPLSFSRTIENIFYFSFLIKDGFAQIYLDDDAMPVVVPISSASQSLTSNSDNKKANIQSMISMTKLEWKELIEVFGIENAVISDPNQK